MWIFMKMKAWTPIGLFLALFLFISPEGHAQRWKYYRYEIMWSAGASTFLGDLGGSDHKASHGIMGLRDIDWQATRPAAGVGMRFKVTELIGVKGNFYLSMLAGNDKYTNYEERRNRNLHFRSVLIETSVQGEISLIKERMGYRYSFKTWRGWRSFVVNTYLFAGVGGFFFNPQAKYQGRWYNLQPRGTEGQGFEGEPQRYYRTAVCFPVGIGFKYAIDRIMVFGIEAGLRYTTTDYIDDVSTWYYKDSIMLAERGIITATLADPSPKVQDYTDETQAKRGDFLYNDVYGFIMVNISYRLRARRDLRPVFYFY
jgi:hypothetical protein